MNKVIIIGNNTKQIELKQTSSGTSVAEFSIAVKRSFKSANGEQESDFFNCVAFSKLAETVSKYVGKGDKIAVEGRLQTRNYTNKEGRKIYVTEIIVENVEFLQTKSRDEQKPTDTTDADPFAPTFTPSVPNFEDVDADEGLPF
jgi:single-strand DNA-binding protein